MKSKITNVLIRFVCLIGLVAACQDPAGPERPIVVTGHLRSVSGAPLANVQLFFSCGYSGPGVFGWDLRSDSNGRYELRAGEPFGLVPAPDGFSGDTYRCLFRMPSSTP